MGSKSIRLCGEDIYEPGHICAFFTTREEEYETLIPYVKQGVEAGEENDRLDGLDAAQRAWHRGTMEMATHPSLPRRTAAPRTNPSSV